MIAAPILVTERLILRPPQSQDLDGFAEFCADPQTMRFLGGKTMTRSEAWRTMCSFAGAFALTGVSMFSVVERSTGRWIGRVGPWQPDGWPGTEVGWGLLRSAEGKGYATEAAAAAIDYATGVLGWTDIIHVIDPDNAASAALAARLGATNRGATRLPAPFEGLRVDSWGQSAADWQRNRQSLNAR